MLNKYPLIVQSLSRAQLFATSWSTACQAPLSFTVSWSLLRFMSTESVMLSNHLILCHPLLLCLQCFPASESFPMSWLFSSGGRSIGASASVCPMNIQVNFLWNWLVWSCCPRNSQESSPAAQFESINSSAVILYFGDLEFCKPCLKITIYFYDIKSFLKVQANLSVKTCRVGVNLHDG